MIASLLKIASSPMARSMAKAVLKATGQAIKARRTRRLQAGKRVAGWRVRRFAQRRGFGGMLPIQIPSTPGNSVVNVPTKIASTQDSVNAARNIITRTDLNITVLGAQDSDQVNTRVQHIPLYASNTAVCPSGVGAADSYSFFRFNYFRWVYRTAVGTGTDGQIVVAWCPTIDAANAITDTESAIQASAATRLAPYYSDDRTHSVTPQTLNMQYYQQGYKIVPMEDFTSTDPTLCQGYLVIVKGGGTATGAAWGQIQLSYQLELLKPQPPGAVGAGMVDVAEHNYTVPDASWAADLATAHESTAHVNCNWTYSDNGAGALRVTAASKHPYLFIVHYTATGAGAGISAAGGTGCVVAEVMHGLGADTGGHAAYLVTPTVPDSFLELSEGANTIDSIVTMAYTLPRRNLAWIDDVIAI